MSESLDARWGWEAYDPDHARWRSRRVRFSTLREAHAFVGNALDLGLVARVVDYAPPPRYGVKRDMSSTWRGRPVPTWTVVST